MLKLLLSSLVLWNAVALVLFQRSDMFGSCTAASTKFK